jgi:hypothetical protein
MVKAKGKHGGPRPGGGRPKGLKNRATIERETLAIQAALEAARAAEKRPGGTKLAIQEMQKALALSEGLAGKLRPKLEEGPDGALIIKDVQMFRLFGEWFDRWFNIQRELAKYQSPPMRAVEAPTPPPDPADVEQKSRKRFGLRVFEGGKPLTSA